MSVGGGNSCNASNSNGESSSSVKYESQFKDGAGVSDGGGQQNVGDAHRLRNDEGQEIVILTQRADDAQHMCDNNQSLECEILKDF